MSGPRRRPWWWLLNPYLYTMRIERAYEDALTIIQEDGRRLAAYDTAKRIAARAARELGEE